jgi:hypothetical protein
MNLTTWGAFTTYSNGKSACANQVTHGTKDLEIIGRVARHTTAVLSILGVPEEHNALDLFAGGVIELGD